VKRIGLAAVTIVGLLAVAYILTMSGGIIPNWPDTLAGVREDFPDVRQMSTDELASVLNNAEHPAPLILDIREPEEFEVSHLPGARQVSPGSDPGIALGDIPRDQPIVVYCSVGYRSSRFAARLAEAGFADVANLEGSIFQWANEGRPLENASGGANVKVHPYDARWGKLLDPDLRADTEK
jgi:rhodanese-related sulfurtransferase